MQAVLEKEVSSRATHRYAAAGRWADAEHELLAAARRGEAAAYTELMARYEARIFRLAYRITRNHEDAEEVTQDAFARAFSRLDTFQGDSRFSTWLTRIAVNQALMLLRKRRPEALPLDELVETEDGSLPRQIVDWGPNPEQRFAQEELSAILDAAIAELKTDQRVVFQLRDVEQLSIEETAALLGISVPAVKTRLLRARLALREKLNRYFRPPAAAVQPAWAAAGSK
jgi:RNA polymerase sigma-70 factor (ECF subfamily)